MQMRSIFVKCTLEENCVQEEKTRKINKKGT